jgi:sugar lactone lactonase YvrE
MKRAVLFVLLLTACRHGRTAPDDPVIVYARAMQHSDLGSLRDAHWPLGVDELDFPNGDPALMRELNARVPRVARSSSAFVIRQRDLIPEGIAYDAADDVFYVSSIRHGKVVRVARDGTATDFATGLFATLGLKVDAARRRLWVASYAAPETAGYNAADEGRAAAYEFDLATGRLLRTISTTKSLLNDLAIAADGTVYITDSLAGRVLRVPPGATAAETFAEGFSYPNGIALSDDGAQLFVADFRGITRFGTWGPASAGPSGLKPARTLTPPPGETLGAIDGLTWHRGSLIAVQNAVGRPRILRIRLAPVAVEVLESGNPLFVTPTTGTMAGDDYVYMANPQIRSFNAADHTIWPAERLQDVVVLKISTLP